MKVCNVDNLSACGEPPLSFASKEAICEEGSLSVLFVVLFLATIFGTKQLLYRQRKCKIVRGIMNTSTNNTSNTNNGSFMEAIGHQVEEIFVKPFVPTSLENMITTIYVVYFMLTITMGATRYFEKHWANDPLAQQGPFNLLSWAFGCESVGVAGLVYTPKMPDLLQTVDSAGNATVQGLFQFTKAKLLQDKPTSTNDSSEAIAKDYYETIDWLFTLHLAMGTVWLTIGCLQIVWTRTGWSIDKDIRRAAHRMFGKFATISFVMHMGVASLMVFRNPVQQAWPIIVFYWIDIADNCIQAAMGIAWAIEAKRLRNAFEETAAAKAAAASDDDGDGDESSLTKHQNIDKEDDYQSAKNMHEFRMVTVYLRSTFGSGAIRITVWLLWLVGKFLPFEARILIDRGECQAFAQMLGSDMMGQADMCLKPVFLNLAATDVFVVWLEWLFVCILAQQDKRLTAVDAKATKIKLYGYVIAGFAYVATLRSESSLASNVIIFYSLCTKLRVIHDHIAHFILTATEPNIINVDCVGRCEFNKGVTGLSISSISTITIDDIAGAKFRGGISLLMQDLKSEFPGLDGCESSYDDTGFGLDEAHLHQD
ncbi:MAG: hypothetical protein SGBAC_006509 [Bacillariaceae sp.]